MQVKWPYKISAGSGLPCSQLEKSTNFPLTLATGDSSGLIVIWDVVTGTAIHSLSEGNKPIQGLLILKSLTSIT